MTVNQVKTYALAVSNLFQNEGYRQEMTTACLEDAGKYTLENMAVAFIQGISKILAEKYSA